MPPFEQITGSGRKWKVDGFRLVDELRRSHLCEASCWNCKEENREYQREPFHRWEKFINSPDAMRVAILVVEYKQDFPVISENDIEQFLITEGVLSRYYREKAERQNESTANSNALDAAQNALQEHLNGQ